MTKSEFLQALQKRIDNLPEEEIKKSLEFYSEMIEDRTEEGMSEEEAVAAIGGVNETAEQILREIPLRKLVTHRIKPKRRLNAGEVILLILGAPLWIPLCITLVSVFFSVIVSLFAVIFSLWSVDISLALSLPALLAAGGYFAVTGFSATGLLAVACGLVAGGLSIPFFILCKVLGKYLLLLCKGFVFAVKKLFAGGNKQ